MNQPYRSFDMTFTELLASTDSFTFVTTLCILGITICIYAIEIETTESSGKKGQRMCDVNDSMSCTLVLTSKYSHMTKLMFGLRDDSFFNKSNAQYGLLFYVCLLASQFYPFTSIPYHSYLFLGATVASVLASLGLAWILWKILRNFCMICVCMYFINFALLTSAIMHINNAA